MSLSLKTTLWISIHASAKEATASSPLGTSHDNFNPRLREGGDDKMELISDKVKIFQSTPPRRRRHMMPM